jgi:D-glycero-D-manno-heptose 1,7-bisphosphate phosphatase
MQKTPAAFLDRDGVINKDLGYTYKTSDLELIEGVPEALQKLRSKGFLLIIITNQSGVARGYYDLKDVEKFHNALDLKIKAAIGKPFDGIFVCPHLAAGSVAEYSLKCRCRKPEVGLLEQAVERFEIDLDHSVMIGDKPSDVLCGYNFGVRTIQICKPDQKLSEADASAQDLLEAARTATTWDFGPRR